MQGTSSWRQCAGHLATAFLFLVGATAANAGDTFNSSNYQLTIPSLVIGNATYSNVVVIIGSVVSVQLGAPNGSQDSYTPSNNQLAIPSVMAFGHTYTNVVVTVATLISIGGASGVDSYNPVNGELSIPNVLITSGALANQTFCNVVVTPSAIDGAIGGMPQSPEDAYSPLTRQLIIPAATVLGHSFVFTNVTVTVSKVLAHNSGCGAWDY
jgi:hypothetical protein